MSDPMFGFVVQEAADGGDGDMPLVCVECRETVCTIEVGDALDTLVAVAQGHSHRALWGDEPEPGS